MDRFAAKRADRGTRGMRRTVCLGAILLGCILVLCLLAGSAAKKVRHAYALDERDCAFGRGTRCGYTCRDPLGLDLSQHARARLAS
jgi:hypothetical protein